MSAAVLERKPKEERKGPKRKSEFDSRSVSPTQMPSFKMPPLDEKVTESPNGILLTAKMPSQIQAEALLFNDEPVKILVHQSGERHAAKCTDLVAINGVKAEVLFDNGWVPVGYLPRGVAFYTKRKYLEVMARAKKTECNTRVVKHDDINRPYENHVDFNTSSIMMFSVIEDKNPKGVEWLSRLLSQM